MEYPTSTDTDIWRQNLWILPATSISLWRHQNCYVYTWNAKTLMYLFLSDIGNTTWLHFWRNKRKTSKQFSECTGHINLWHLQTTSTWGKGGIKNSTKNTEKRFPWVGTYHENKFARWIYMLWSHAMLHVFLFVFTRTAIAFYLLWFQTDHCISEIKQKLWKSFDFFFHSQVSDR